MVQGKAQGDSLGVPGGVPQHCLQLLPKGGLVHCINGGQLQGRRWAGSCVCVQVEGQRHPEARGAACIALVIPDDTDTLGTAADTSLWWAAHPGLPASGLARF